MSSMLECHTKLTDGKGKCSVPMWCDGMPAGLCNEDAFGKQEPEQSRYGKHREGKWYPGYAGGFACYKHGGPKCPATDTNPQSESRDSTSGLEKAKELAEKLEENWGQFVDLPDSDDQFRLRVPALNMVNLSRAVLDLSAKLDDWESTAARVMAEECAPDERHCMCVPVLRKRIEELEETVKRMAARCGVLQHCLLCAALVEKKDKKEKGEER